MSKFWAITCFFNSAGFQAPLRNHGIFARRLAEQGVPLLTVELAFGNNPFVLPDDMPNLHRLRSQSVLWQKERLLNHALDLLPAECTQVAWLDSDILWPDRSWVERAQDALDRHHDVVQLFEGVFRLFSGQHQWTELNPQGTPLWWEPGTAFHLVNDRPFENTCIGFAWAARREWLAHVRLYDRAILGGGDFILLHALFNREHTWDYDPLDQDIAPWRSRLRETNPRVGYVAGTICHLFHGNLGCRRYANRHTVLTEHNYKPQNDIYLIHNTWEWATHKPALHAAVRCYFRERHEDEEWREGPDGSDVFLLGHPQKA